MYLFLYPLYLSFIVGKSKVFFIGFPPLFTKSSIETSFDDFISPTLSIPQNVSHLKYQDDPSYPPDP